MFGISFGELLLIGLIALLVLGPERLPGAARTAGLWIGRLKRSFNAIKTEVEREIGADEIRRQLHNEHIMSLEKQIKDSIMPPTADTAATESEPESAATVSAAAPAAPASSAPAAAPAAPAASAPAPGVQPVAAPSSATAPTTPATAQAPVEPQQPSRTP
ncbi:Sec-independent protein translocase protein TatB [Metapseudomonas resinovorans]|uniref:Sec-independent protein translocase protein TatB n=1 Tax=Metapseudomonas resinovorans NBRC 106553 TaxID=1245471 RepID=S6AJS1_METRE|nr:Sec-independent protein translocase protein TatB [Pseudomonas resinovorans]BAN51022.1 Sec-independent protein translocase protein TatB [Pseudomonas resinovorans NBRC 106553]